MLYTIGVILILLWLLGLLTSFAMGGIMDALLPIGIILVIIRFISGRRAFWNL